MTQDRALELMTSGANIFLSGPPGSGKSFVLEQFVGVSRRFGRRLALTATTGIAASLLGGVTIHSWSGLGVKQQLAPTDIDLLLANPHLVRRLTETEILIIDEISMLDAVTFESIDRLLKVARSSSASFGEIQLILSGDFFQLPPVSNNDDSYCFLSNVWADADLKACYLSEQHRQSSDELLEVLSALREQRFTKNHLEMLSARQGVPHPPLTMLLTHNKDVDVLNNKRLAELGGQVRSYLRQCKGDKGLSNDLERSVLAPKELFLKVGAEVMFVANDPQKQYVNGTQGSVVAFRFGLPVIELKESKVAIVAQAFSWKRETDNRAAELIQLPIKLAWAITIHKCQGMSLDAADIDLKRSFVSGMGYVALSRLKKYRGLYLQSYNSRSLELDKTVYAFDRELRKNSDINEVKETNSELDRIVQSLHQAGMNEWLIKQSTGLTKHQLKSVFKRLNI
ncbi:MAG: PIF1 family DEAD/DEAH box helicase [Candidatus Saccharimonadales bacterium]